MIDLDSEMTWMAGIQLQIDSGGNAAWYDKLARDVRDRQATWKDKDAGGPFSGEEITRLVARADALLGDIEQQRSRSVPPSN
jgi:hypothetical protein